MASGVYRRRPLKRYSDIAAVKERIKRLLEQGKSVYDTAREADVSPATVWRMKRGDWRPARALEALAKKGGEPTPSVET
jgi:transposase-like protein